MNIATASMPFLKAGMGAFKMLKGVAKGKLYRFRHLDEVCNCFVAGTLVTVAAEGDPATGVGDGDSSRLVGASQADWANDSAAAESAGLRSEEERPPGSIVEMARDTSWGAADREQPLPGADLLSRPIECVEVGDLVLTRSERDSVSEPRPGRVTAVFRAVAPAILWLGLSSGETLGTTPGHEVWTVEHGWTSAAYVRPGDTFVDPFGAPVTIESATLDEHPTPVYNLEVDGTFTYYADGVWVHNNSRCDTLADRAAMGRRAQKYGTEFEKMALEHLGIPKYNGPNLRHGNTNFNPDFYLDGVIGDIKGGQDIRFDDQLKAIAGYAQKNNLRAVLYVPLIDNIRPGDYERIRKWFEVVEVP